VTSRHRTRRFLILGVLLAMASDNVSAQLLTKLLRPLTKPAPTAATASACSIASLATSPKLDAAMQQWARSGGVGSQQVIVSAGAGALATVTTLVLGLGSTVLGALPGINGLVARVDLDDLASLVCALPVSSISIDAVVHATSDVDAPAPESLRATLGLPLDTPSGEGVTVAVIDSGIAPSADVANRIVAFFDATLLALPTSPSDDYGHGTHVAGLIAGGGVVAGDGRYQGIGPKVRLVGMKVLDATGAGRTSDVIRAVELTTLLRPILGVQIINLSLGHPIYEPASRDPLVRAVEAASRAGIVVVTAAGNYGYNADTGESGYGGIASPGNAPSAITVGASMTEDTTNRNDDRIAPYSSRGPSWYDAFSKPDIVAPGHRLVSDASSDSTLFATYPSARVVPGYLRLSGTSMATAVATGAVALVIEAHQQAYPNAPALTPNLVKGILQYSSLRLHDSLGADYDDLTQGAGSLNPVGARDLARAIDTRQPAGWYWLTSSITPSTTLQTDALAWSQRVFWRTQTVWGPTIDTHQIAWAFNTMWGSTNAWDSHIVWGTDTVWGNDAPAWSNHIVWGTNVVGSYSDDGDHIVWGTTNGPGSTAWGNLAATDAGSAGR
jgi:serine protease AprX